MMNQEKLKGHLLILAANILFAINMPVSKYLLPEHVQPEALTSMRTSMPLRPLRSRLEPRAVYLGIEYHVAGRRFHHSDRRPHLCHDLGGPDPKGTDHTDENVRGTAWHMRGDLLDTTIHARFQSSEQSRGKPVDYG